MTELGSEPLVHQAVHGYRHGHQLLAASESLSPDVAGVLAQNSDSAPRSKSATRSYLTGYGLRDGRFVVARTWPVADAVRPNTVVTRSVLIPVAVPAGFSGTALLDSLNPPNPEELLGRINPVPVSSLFGTPLRLSPREVVDAVSYYSTVRPIRHDDSNGRDRIAIAIWLQLWLPARNELLFCTALDTNRFANADHPLRFSEEPANRNVSPLKSRSLAIVGRDLESPGAFREFVQFVGSGEPSDRLMVTFARAYQVLSSESTNVGDFVRLLAAAEATQPQRLRRLKRRLLSFVNGRPRWNVDPVTLLVELSSGLLGEYIYARDASLENWLARCWSLDPQATATILTSSESILVDDSGIDDPTAAQGIRRAFIDTASSLISSRTLPLAIEVDAVSVMRAVWQRNDLDLWSAYGQLEEPPSPDEDITVEPYDWTIPIHALRQSPTSLARFIRGHPVALETLISIVAAEPLPSDFDLHLDRKLLERVSDVISSNDERVVGLGRLADVNVLPKNLNAAAWEAVLVQSSDEVVAAVAYLIARSGGEELSRVLTVAMARLYDLLSHKPADQGWVRIETKISGDRHTWDRCHRLVVDYASILSRFSSVTRSEAVKLLEIQNPSAAEALREHVYRKEGKRKRFNLFDPSTWFG